MTPAAAVSNNQLGGVLWSPAHRAYVRQSGGYTRRLTLALRVDEADTDRIARQIAADDRSARPVLTFEQMTPGHMPSESLRRKRDGLADLNEEELLRRAVRSLCATDRTHAPHWALVMDTLGLTSGAAVMLCRRLNIDPNERTGQ